MGDVYGIDLGTTFCSCARMDDTDVLGDLEDLELDGGGGDRHKNLPSVIYAHHHGGRVMAIVGRRAREQPMHPTAVLIERAKRYLGTPDAPDWQVGDIAIDPVLASALILARIKNAVSPDDSPEPFRAVVTHPRDFFGNRKELVAQAAQLAGIDLVATLNEPEAAALSFFGSDDAIDVGTYLVFDLGGGTLDIAVLRKEDGAPPRVIGGHGDPKLGGADWDNKTIQWLEAKACTEHALDEYVAAMTDESAQRFRDFARVNVKEAFSNRKQFTVRFRPKFSDGRVLETPFQLLREDWESACAALVSRCREAIFVALEDCKLGPDGISRVLLVGGSTRLEMVRKLLGEVFPGKVLDGGPNPDLAVSRGAARYAAITSRRALAQTTDAAAGTGGNAEAALEIAPAMETTLAHAINVKVNKKVRQDGVERPMIWLEEVIAAGQELPICDHHVSLRAQGAGKIVIGIYEGPGGEYTEGRKPTLQLRLPVVNAHEGDIVSAYLSVDDAGRLSARAVHQRTGAEVKGSLEAEHDGRAKFAERARNLAAIVFA